MSTLVHFEIPSDNLERTKKFYTELFDEDGEDARYGSKGVLDVLYYK
jgi:predicted enzyme related to lactoylglutathione lyase